MSMIDLARETGAYLDLEGPTGTLDAPTGFVWASDMVHGLAFDQDEPGAYQRTKERAEMGLIPCPDTDCDMCEGR